jgi:Rhodanese-related sulfurtransferase
MPVHPDSHFVTADWVFRHIGDPDVAVIDGSWHMPAAGRNGRAEFVAGHIPGAVFFDLDAIADTASPLPHMLPSPDAFAAAVGALGVRETQTIVVYDSLGLFSAARVWWTFRTMGARDVVLLDGGLPAWIAAELPLEAGEAASAPAVFTPQFDSTAVRSFDDVRVAGRARSPDRRCPVARTFPRTRGGAACRFTVGTHAGRDQPALRRDDRRRPPQVGNRPAITVRRPRHRSRQAGHRELRLGCIGRGHCACPRHGRSAQCGHL